MLCLDEVGFQLGMDPKKGWSKKGTRCIIKKQKIKDMSCPKVCEIRFIFDFIVNLLKIPSYVPNKIS